ncbi:ECF RNA polymerase sigma factor SigW [Botrimarina colliarenosi]|uniref:ECF RNA polymerase sigma factor SigW n=1 Tax=Botrimarina colliarenosi TaxID=2528001 RepID=A0A5C6ALW0_9BACT|nr:sigma-70 family RNA polymerase sigma factor [Botrimarina colliarenosi]TWU00630.1 ECF RNA polymerase sigma factor SigW [Botrimarina colliarenosi]
MSTPSDPPLAEPSRWPTPRAAALPARPAPARGGASTTGGLLETDGELLRLFTRHDDAAAIDRLIDRHAPMVWRVCRQSLRRQQDAEDAFQATFLQLVKGARQIGASESAAGWLYRVAYRTSLRARKRLAARREEALALDPTAPPEQEFPDLSRRWTAGVLAEELMQLPERYQTPLVMRYLEGQSRRAIAEATDLTIATVQGRLARGKQMLRRRLISRGVSLSAAMGALAVDPKSAGATVPTQVVLQTTSNATAVATGGSLAASAAVVSLFQQGTRAMLFASLSKPLVVATACGVAALVLAAPPVESTVTTSSDGVVLTAAVEGEEAETPTATLQIVANDAASEGEPGALATVVSRVYLVADIVQARAMTGEVVEQEKLLEQLAKEIEQIAGVESSPVSQPANSILVLKASREASQAVSDYLQMLRNRMLDGRLNAYPPSVEPEASAPGVAAQVGGGGAPSGSPRTAESTSPPTAGFNSRDGAVTLAQGSTPAAAKAVDNTAPNGFVAEFKPGELAPNVRYGDALGPDGEPLSDAKQGKILLKRWAERAAANPPPADGEPTVKELHLWHTYWEQKYDILRRRTRLLLEPFNGKSYDQMTEEDRLRNAEAEELMADMYKARAETLRYERELKLRALNEGEPEASAPGVEAKDDSTKKLVPSRGIMRLEEAKALADERSDIQIEESDLKGVNGERLATVTEMVPATIAEARKRQGIEIERNAAAARAQAYEQKRKALVMELRTAAAKDEDALRLAKEILLAESRHQAELARVEQLQRHLEVGEEKVDGRRSMNRAYGHSVETLQQALNERLAPEFAIEVDGDYGPATASAVARWQRQAKVPATGFADDVTRNSLDLADSPVEVPLAWYENPFNQVEGVVGLASQLHGLRNQIELGLRRRVHETTWRNEPLSQEDQYLQYELAQLQANFDSLNKTLRGMGFNEPIEFSVYSSPRSKQREETTLIDERDAVEHDEASAPSASDAAAVPDTGPVYVVGTYSGADGAPLTVTVEPTAEPITLVLCAYYFQDWRLELKEGAELGRVIVAGYNAQRIDDLKKSLPAGVPLDVYTYFPTKGARNDTPRPESIGDRAYFWAFKPTSEEYFDLVEKIKTLTGRDVASFVGEYQGDSFTVSSEPATPAPQDDAASLSKDGWKAFFSRDHAAAEKLFRQALAADPDDLSAVNGLGFSLLNQGKHEEAKPQFERFLAESPDAPGPLNGLARCLEAEGDIDGAVAIWERLVAAQPDVLIDPVYSLARVYEARGETEKAAPLKKRIAAEQPNPAEYQELLKQQTDLAEAPPQEAALRSESMNRLKDLGLALLNYESDRGHLPPPVAINRETGKQNPGLSWRVELLPLLGHQDLYDEFHLNEPWDSPHNLTLLTKMPDAFRDPRSTHPQEAGKTNYLASTGPGAFMEKGKSRQFREFRDGTSRTIALLEVADEHAVEWTRPSDFDTLLHAPAPRLGIGSFEPGKFLASFVDGSIHQIGDDTSSEDLRKMLLIDDEASNAAPGESGDRYGSGFGAWRDAAPSTQGQGDSGSPTEAAIDSSYDDPTSPQLEPSAAALEIDPFGPRLSRQGALTQKLAERVPLEPSVPGDSGSYPEQSFKYGASVYQLQRRLNDVLSPSPRLSVDGDYGPQTEAAVKRFQKLRELPETGFADTATREALGFVESKTAQYGPGSTMKQGQWRVFHEPSQLDPAGWCVIAELRDGEHLPVLLPGDKRPRPHLRREGDPGSGKFRVVDPGHPDDGKVISGGWAGEVVEVRGERINVSTLSNGPTRDIVLVLIRGEQGRAADELAESLPNHRLARRLLYEQAKPIVSPKRQRRE